MSVRNLPGSVAPEATIPDAELDCPSPTSETMLSFALAVASQIEDRTLKEGLSAGLVSSIDPEPPATTASVLEMVASTCAAIEAISRARLATRRALERSM